MLLQDELNDIDAAPDRHGLRPVYDEAAARSMTSYMSDEGLSVATALFPFESKAGYRWYGGDGVLYITPAFSRTWRDGSETHIETMLEHELGHHREAKEWPKDATRLPNYGLDDHDDWDTPLFFFDFNDPAAPSALDMASAREARTFWLQPVHRGGNLWKSGWIRECHFGRETEHFPAQLALKLRKMIENAKRDKDLLW